MATIKIERQIEIINGMRNYKLYVDGQRLGTIGSGETKTFSLAAGPHQLVAKIDWCSSPTVAIMASEQEYVTLKVAGNNQFYWIFASTVGIIALHLILKNTTDFDFTIYLLAPIFLWYVYFMTLARNRYLTLTRSV